MLVHIWTRGLRWTCGVVSRRRETGPHSRGASGELLAVPEGLGVRNTYVFDLEQGQRPSACGGEDVEGGSGESKQVAKGLYHHLRVTKGQTPLRAQKMRLAHEEAKEILYKGQESKVQGSILYNTGRCGGVLQRNCEVSRGSKTAKATLASNAD